MTGDRSSQVRVGVRIRPLTSKEIQQGGNASLSVFPPSSITIASNKTFTYDAVFDSRTNQDELYSGVSSSLLDSFLDGYNATVSKGSFYIQIEATGLLTFLCFFTDTCLWSNRIWQNLHYG